MKLWVLTNPDYYGYLVDKVADRQRAGAPGRDIPRLISSSHIVGFIISLLFISSGIEYQISLQHASPRMSLTTSGIMHARSFFEFRDHLDAGN